MNCFSIEQNFENWLIGWLMDERFYVKKTELKGNAVDNYWHISCLPLLWKLLAGFISEHLYRFLEEEKILPEEQEGWKEIAEDLKISYYWTKQCLETAKG